MGVLPVIWPGELFQLIFHGNREFLSDLKEKSNLGIIIDRKGFVAFIFIFLWKKSSLPKGLINSILQLDWIILGTLLLNCGLCNSQ